MKPEFDRLEASTRDLLRPLRDARLEPSPFLKTRVLARVRTEPRRGFWSVLARPRLALSALVVLLALGIWQVSARKDTFHAATHSPVVVKLDTHSLTGKQIASARIELPKGVEFYSKRFPDIQEKAALELSFGDGQVAVPAALPIVVKAGEEGVKLVRVKFFNSENRMMSEKVVRIHFQSRPDGGEAV